MKKVLELEAGNRAAATAIARLEPIVNEKREKMKDEMLGELNSSARWYVLLLGLPAKDVVSRFAEFGSCDWSLACC